MVGAGVALEGEKLGLGEGAGVGNGLEGLADGDRDDVISVGPLVGAVDGLGEGAGVGNGTGALI